MTNHLSIVDNLTADRDWFVNKYSEALQSIEKLHETTLEFLDAVVPATQDIPAKEIYFLACGCLREFNEVLLLCSNRYGIGALKILRPLYERVVTLKYLSEHPEEVESFQRYSTVHLHKLLIESDVMLAGRQQVEGEARTSIEQRYENVKSQFKMTMCKKCGRQGLQSSWTKKGLPELAQAAGEDIRKIYFMAFLLPTLHIHTTHWGISSQLKEYGDKGIGDNPKAEDQAVFTALSGAHVLLLEVIAVLNDHFELERAEEVVACARSSRDVWTDHS